MPAVPFFIEENSILCYDIQYLITELVAAILRMVLKSYKNWSIRYMNSSIKETQEEAVNLQLQLGQLVDQTDKLFADIRNCVANVDAQSMNILATQIRFRLLQYQSLYQKMEDTAILLDSVVEESKERTQSVLATSVMLRQMQQQILLEEKNLKTVAQEIESWKLAADAGETVQQAALLHSLKKALEESRD